MRGERHSGTAARGRGGGGGGGHVVEAAQFIVQPLRNNKSQSADKKALAIRRSSNGQAASSIISSNLPKLSSWLTHLCSLLFLLAALLLTINKPCQSVLVYFDDDEPTWPAARAADIHMGPEQVKQDCNQSQTSQQSQPDQQGRRSSSDSLPASSRAGAQLQTDDVGRRRRRQQRHQQHQWHTSDHDQSGSKQKPCHDCLAIPLVAIMGDRQISGYLIPPTRAQVRSPDHRPAVADELLFGHQKEATDGHYAAYNHSQHSAGAMTHQQAHSLEPKSDEHCPMTGPLTVCDQINSYPNDVILDKLEGAKRRLKQSYFNLDSLFSDERDHSSEPFDDDQPPASRGSGGADGPARPSTMKPPTSTLAQPRRSNSRQVEPHKGYHPGPAPTPLRAQKDGKPMATTSVPRQSALSAYERQRSANNRHYFAGSANIDHGMEEGAINYNEPSIEAPPLEPVQHEAHTKTDSLNAHLSQLSTNHDTDQSLGRWKAAANQRHSMLPSGDADDFVDLVERNAFSLRTTRRPSTGKSSLPLYKPPDTLSSISNTTLVNKLLPTLHRGHQDHYRNSPVDGDTSSRLVAYNGHGSQQLSDNEQENLARGASTKHQRSIKTARRLRRQVSVRVNSGNEAEVQSDPDNVATEGDNGAGNSGAGDTPDQPEPICKSKSIYISPRAALNDKKQWKYVVNAPERIPQIRQVIRVDICQDPFGPCSDQVDIPFGFISQCKQKYSKKKLLALDSQSGLLEVDTFFIPSCCVCQLIRDNRALDDISTTRPLPDFESRLEAQPTDANNNESNDRSRDTDGPADSGDVSSQTDTAQPISTNDRLGDGSSRIPL